MYSVDWNQSMNIWLDWPHPALVPGFYLMWSLDWLLIYLPVAPALLIYWKSMVFQHPDQTEPSRSLSWRYHFPLTMLTLVMHIWHGYFNQALAQTHSTHILYVYTRALPKYLSSSWLHWSISFPMVPSHPDWKFFLCPRWHPILWVLYLHNRVTPYDFIQDSRYEMTPERPRAI